MNAPYLAGSAPNELAALLAAATPFLRITDVVRRDWCRNANDTRYGPWRYQAVFEVLDRDAWNRKGEVLYFATDAQARLRLVGESSKRLKDRWRESPMHEVGTRAPMSEHALFHSTSWPAIEAAFDAGERPPFTVSAIFAPDLRAVCDRVGGALAAASAAARSDRHGLAWHVESWACTLKKSAGLPLWNLMKTR